MNVKLLISKLLVLSKSATFVLVTMFFMVPSNMVVAGDLARQFTLHNPPGFGNNIQCTLHNPPGFGNNIQFRLYNPPGFGTK